MDPNRASAAELDLLPGIGPSLAKRIVANREEHGPFLSVDQLGRVKGIGARTVERLRPLLRPGAAARDAAEVDRDAGGWQQFLDE